MLFIWYPKCSTCQKARKWLAEHHIEVEERHIKDNNPTPEEIRRWHERSGLPLQKFFNTSGTLYRQMHLSEKLPQMSEQAKIELLASDGMLVKRPLLIDGDTVIVGFREKEYEKLL